MMTYVIDEITGLNNITLTRFDVYLSKLNEQNIERSIINKYGYDIAEEVENLLREI